MLVYWMRERQSQVMQGWDKYALAGYAVIIM